MPKLHPLHHASAESVLQHAQPAEVRILVNIGPSQPPRLPDVSRVKSSPRVQGPRVVKQHTVSRVHLALKQILWALQQCVELEGSFVPCLDLFIQC